MDFIIAQATQPAGYREWSTAEWLIILTFVCVTLLPAVAAFWNSLRNKQTTSNLAEAVKDVATTKEGRPNANLSSGTLSTLNNISRGGTGNSSASEDK